MGISIDPKIKMLVAEYLNRTADIVNEEVMKALSYLGEMCVTRIRDRGGAESWFDQTGNLRSSIGYALLNYGRVKIESEFGQVLNGVKGKTKGKQMITSLAQKYSEAYALVVVAGMEYADEVEALENKDVLASTNLWAIEKVDSILREAKEKAMKRIKNMKL